MNMASFLPHRRRLGAAGQEHDETLAGILALPPIRPAADGLVLFTTLGSEDVPGFLLAAKTLWARIGRGRVAVFDDGTLRAQDRTLLAQNCGDPEILRPDDDGAFPAGPAWRELANVLDRRTGEYWLRVSTGTITLGPVHEIERAVGANRSCAMIDGGQTPEMPLAIREFCHRAFPRGPAAADGAARIESRLGDMTGLPAWRYLRTCPGVTGFAAGNGGRDLAAAFHARLADLVGQDCAASDDAAAVTANFVLANETQPVCLPRSRYCDYAGLDWSEEAAVIRFAPEEGFADGAYLRAATQAIAALSG